MGKIAREDRAVRRGGLRRWTERGLLVAGVVLLGAAAVSYLEASLVQWYLGAELDRGLAEDGTAVAAGGKQSAASPGSLLGRIEIPRLGLSTIILEGTDASTLRRAVGHIPGTALPGSRGNVGLAGHRDRSFRRLRDARCGDSITVTTTVGSFRYRIESLSVVDPHRTDVLAPAEEYALTLVTCHPFHYVGRAPRRFIVRATTLEP